MPVLFDFILGEGEGLKLCDGWFMNMSGVGVFTIMIPPTMRLVIVDREMIHRMVPMVIVTLLWSSRLWLNKFILIWFIFDSII